MTEVLPETQEDFNIELLHLDIDVKVTPGHQLEAVDAAEVGSPNANKDLGNTVSGDQVAGLLPKPSVLLFKLAVSRRTLLVQLNR